MGNHLWQPRSSVRAGLLTRCSPLRREVTEKTPSTPGVCGGVRYVPGWAPLPASCPACLFKKIRKSRGEARHPPQRRPVPRCRRAAGLGPFPAVCCHLPSAAAAGGSRGAPAAGVPGGTLPWLPSRVPGRCQGPELPRQSRPRRAPVSRCALRPAHVCL